PFTESKKRAIAFFRDTIMPAIKKVYKLGEKQGPTLTMLEEQNLRTFISGAIVNRLGLTYNEFLNLMGFKINFDKSRYRHIFYDGKKKVKLNGSIQRAIKFFKEVIIPEIKREFNLDFGQTPTSKQVSSKFGGFPDVLRRLDILYNDMVELAGYQPYDSDICSEIGRHLHIICELIFLKFTREKGCRSYYEVLVNKNSMHRQDFKNRRCDNSIIVDDNFTKLSAESLNLCNNNPNIRLVNIDYYLGNSERSAVNHCQRGYQGDNKMLILVPTNAKGKQNPPKDIPYRKNVRIINPEEFTRFLGLKGNLKKEFISMVKLAKDAAWKEETYLEKLRKIAKESKEILKNKYNFSQKALVAAIKKDHSLSIDLLKYNVDKSNLKYYLNSFSK
ncbi:MAG: hypothetical protein ACFFCS_03180, partial [Candidatus Hodarchaeota archaeon]